MSFESPSTVEKQPSALKKFFEKAAGKLKGSKGYAIAGSAALALFLSSCGENKGGTLENARERGAIPTVSIDDITKAHTAFDLLKNSSSKTVSYDADGHVTVEILSDSTLSIQESSIVSEDGSKFYGNNGNTHVVFHADGSIDLTTDGLAGSDYSAFVDGNTGEIRGYTDALNNQAFEVTDSGDVRVYSPENFRESDSENYVTGHLRTIDAAGTHVVSPNTVE